MESISEGKQVLSDIEQSIQNALALFNSKSLSGGISQLFIIDDPIVSLHDPQSLGQDQRKETPCPYIVEIPTPSSPPKIEEKIDNRQFSNELPFKDVNMSHESISLPFLENPIKSTIEEMQRVLNAKGDNCSPTNIPSPEEILEIYSKDLGICRSTNTSPRGDAQNGNQNYQKVKQGKKEKKSKKLKQPKSKSDQDKKLDFERENWSKLQPSTSKENKLKELMNIYGCADKMKKPQLSDSTLGSKSTVKRKDSTKRISQNDFGQTNSVAPSKKSKRKKLKNNDKNDVDWFDGDLEVLEKSSRLSTKRKNKLRNGNVKIQKSNLKKKIGGNLHKNHVELKISKGHQIPPKDQKQGNKNNLFKESNFYRKQNKPMQKHLNKSEGNIFFRNKGQGNINEEMLRGSNKTLLKSIPYTKEQYGIRHIHKHNYPEYQNHHPENNSNSLSKNLSEEGEPNKNVILNSGVVGTNSCTMEGLDMRNTQMNFEEMNEDYGPLTQLHYALPTQSSRSKEVERFLHGHYQHLPFVIGQSTNKSHNLWVNIQEALSLIKQKIPQSVEVQNVPENTERPLSVLSKLTIKSTKKSHHQQHCPAAVVDGLYDIPEASGEVEGSWEDHPDCIQANIDPNSIRPRCSCSFQPTLSYKKVLRKIFGGGAADVSEVSMDTTASRDETLQHQGGDTYAAELRKALVSFTQEFEELNNKYEEMLSDENSDKEELQRLETLLGNKEEEIRELIARFQEVQEFSEKARLEGVKSQMSHLSRAGAGLYNLEPFKSTTSIRLAQTLRRVQLFKESLRSRPSVPYLAKSVLQTSY